MIRTPLLVLTLALAGCGGDRISSVLDEPSSDGRWRPDGVLIRSYNVNLEEAAAAVRKLSQSKHWFLLGDDRTEHKAYIRVKTREMVRIEFRIWAPANKATEIGIRYMGGDRAGALRTFENLETLLPNKRITVNQPG